MSKMEARAENTQPSRLNPLDCARVLKGWFLADADHSRSWRVEAKQAFGFVAGDQWDSKDIAILADTKRLPIVFNRVQPVVKAVRGLEINSRKKIAYLPRGGTAGPDGAIKVKVNEILTGASTWMADEADAPDSQSEAFDHAVTCGMGWTEPRIVYDDKDVPDGKYLEPHIDPLEMYWDKNARAKNLVDARRVFRARKVSLEDALAQYPGKEPSDLDAQWADIEDISPGKTIEERRKKIDGEGSYIDPHAEVTIVHAQWIENEPYIRVVDPGTGKVAAVTLEKFEELKAFAKSEGLELVYTRQVRKVFKQCFIGAELLTPVTECPAEDMFSFQCITFELDRNKGTFYGLVRLMLDPQKWANKWLSQILHMLNSTAKGGILAETGAFDDEATAQETYAKADAITFVAEGGLAKIMAKPGNAQFAGYVQLLQFALSAIRECTGVNLEILGLRDVNQPGVLEAQRKQAAMTILATLFDSYTRYRKNIGRVRLTFIQKYLSNGQLITLAGKDGYQLVPLTKDKVMGQYQVIVDNAPTSANEQEETWNAIKEIFPMLAPKLTPELTSMMIEFMPIPSQLKQGLTQALNAPNPQAQMAAKVGLETALAKIRKDLAAAGLTEAQILTEQTKALENLSDINAAEAEANLDRKKAEILELLGMGRHQVPHIPQANVPGFPRSPIQAPAGTGQVSTSPAEPVA